MHKDKKHILFENIIRENKGIMVKIVRSYCFSNDDRNDLLQEIMIQIWSSLDRYNESYKLSTWLYKISLNVAISYVRKTYRHKNRIVTLEEHEDIIQETDSDTKNNLLLLNRFISELGDLDKALAILYLEEKSHVEISEILGITKTNVGTRIARIKEKLKLKFLKEEN